MKTFGELVKRAVREKDIDLAAFLSDAARGKGFTHPVIFASVCHVVGSHGSEVFENLLLAHDEGFRGNLRSV